LEQYGARVEVVKPASIANPDHYYNRARTMAAQVERKLMGREKGLPMDNNALFVLVQIPGGVFMDQFETPANFNAHYQVTGPEVKSIT